MRAIDADTLRHWIEGECKSPSIPRNEAAFGKRILMHMEVMKSEDVQPVMHGEWIPCSERLPENSNTVLITHKGGVSFGWYNGRYWGRGASTKHRLIKTVTAWMPLPEPYMKGEQNED